VTFNPDWVIIKASRLVAQPVPFGGVMVFAAAEKACSEGTIEASMGEVISCQLGDTGETIFVGCPPLQGVLAPVDASHG